MKLADDKKLMEGKPEEGKKPEPEEKDKVLVLNEEERKELTNEALEYINDGKVSPPGE